MVAFVGFRKRWIGEGCGESSHATMKVGVGTSDKPGIEGLLMSRRGRRNLCCSAGFM